MVLKMIRVAPACTRGEAKAREQVELALDDLQAIETFLNAVDHFVDELSLRDLADIADPPNDPDVRRLTHHAQIVLRYAQERVGRARHRLDGCMPAH
jgi:hypothetical protein